MQPLARNQTWRDVGAAVGPIAAGALLGTMSPEQMSVIGGFCAAALAFLMAHQPGGGKAADQPKAGYLASHDRLSSDVALHQANMRATPKKQRTARRIRVGEACGSHPGSCRSACSATR